VTRYEIARLYRTDATGIRDEDLLNEVGYALLARIHDILVVTDAHRGRIHCPTCDTVIPRRHPSRRMDADKTLVKCGNCGWQSPWGEYYRSYSKKHLLAGGVEPFLREFASKFPSARGYGEKIVLIDTLLHRYHWELLGLGGGPGAVNLIGGTRNEVIAFLNELTYGKDSTPGLEENRTNWRKKLDWGKWKEENVDRLTPQHRWEGYDNLEKREDDTGREPAPPHAGGTVRRPRDE
jgi:predicted RNA-binding Zn-ribbon protein involved in translation (DUF1610 family)